MLVLIARRWSDGSATVALFRDLFFHLLTFLGIAAPRATVALRWRYRNFLLLEHFSGFLQYRAAAGGAAAKADDLSSA